MKHEVAEIIQEQLDRIADMNAKTFNKIKEMRRYIISKISNADDEKVLRLINLYLLKKHKEIYQELKRMLIDDLNMSMKESIKIAESNFGDTLGLTHKAYRQFPNTKAVRITNKILNEKAITIRSKAQADRVTNIIKDSVGKGQSIDRTTKLMEIELGYRNSQGIITKSALEMLEQGKLTHTNGSFYNAYRIARTESMRMSHISNYDAFDKLKDTQPNIRLQLIARLDKRTRTQSRNMNRQISDEDGKFLYPDGNYYRLGEAPARWSINDREASIIIFDKVLQK